MGYIFGQNTPWTYDELQRKRAIAQQLTGQIGSPRNVGEGLSAIGKALAARGIEQRASRREGELKEESDQKWNAIFGSLTGQPKGQTYAAPSPSVSTTNLENKSIADDTMRALGKEPLGMPAEVQAGIFAGESGGDYDAVFGYANRGNGPFAGVKPTDMTVGEVLQFQDPSGEYGQWVKGQVGRVATPVGAYQVVGKTLKEAVRAGVVSPDEQFTPEVQDRVGSWILKTQGTGAWEGYRGPQSGGVPANMGGRINNAQAIVEAIVEAMGDPMISRDPGRMAVLNALLGQAMEKPDPRYQVVSGSQLGLGGDMADSYFNVGPDGKVTQIGGAGTSVTVNNTGPEPGRYIYAEDAGLPKGWRFDTQTQTAEMIPGGPDQIEAQRNAAKESRKDTQAKLKLGTSLTSIGLNIDEIEDGGLPVTGPIGDFRRTAVGRALTGSSAFDFENRTSQVTDSAAFAEIQNMRDNSPTGGAVGQLTDKERAAIGNAVTALNSSTSSDEYLRAAKAYRKLALDLAYGEDMWEITEDGEVVSKSEPSEDDGIPVFNPETGQWE